ncbi:XylR family transcriptional regulator [Xenorhabdus sp. Flor]|uniref:XylR family transcriptional regulator n=1 Tax=Xenorhabdus cabanillasii TaxID=351673 RepID=UPI00199A7F09|nr:XylR family transcriptional regulator [Xenorhabdus sp. Flor]MBD2814441.1 XylR family transcriptional regulator [Xenorhabdus sp. Flor]
MNKDKHYRIVLLFNANKVYDRQVVEGVGEYLQASQCNWDVFIEEDFRTRIDNINNWVCDGIIADFDDPVIATHLIQSKLSVIGVGGSYHEEHRYPPVHYIATDNYELVRQAFLHLKQKGLKHFAFYGLPTKTYSHWSNEREHAFRQLVTNEKYSGIIYNGMDITQENWYHAQNRLSDWIHTLPPQTGIIAVTDARARHLLQVCENLNINVPEEISIIGIDDEDMIRYLSRIALSSVVQGSRQMGYLSAKLLHQLLEGHPIKKLQRILVPPVKIVERRSSDFHSFNDPTVIQAMHFIYYNACKGIKTEQVLDAVNMSRSNLEQRFKKEIGKTIHSVIYEEKIKRAQNLLMTTSLSVHEISVMCGYPSLQYFYSIFKKEYGMTPKEFRDK